MKSLLLIILAAPLIGCTTPPVSQLYVSNNSCRTSFLTAAATIAVKHREPIVIPKEINGSNFIKVLSDLNAHSLSIEGIVTALEPKLPIGTETKYLTMNLADNNFLFLIQRGSDEICYAKLAQKSGKNWNYTNTITYIDSQPIANCKCSDNEYQVGF